MARSKNNSFGKHPAITLTILVAILIALLDFTTRNLYLHFSGHYSDRDSQDIERLYREKSDIYHHGLRKNTVVNNATWSTREPGYRISTDSLGFKSRSVRETPLRSDGKRIVFIGDSFTEGIGIEHPETFVGLIEERLAPAGIDVLNAGVVSYAPIIYWRKIKHLIEDAGLVFSELVVFIDISDIEDEANYYSLAPDGSVIKGSTLQNLLRDNTTLAYEIYKRLKQLGEWIIPPDNHHTLEVEEAGGVNHMRSMWPVDEELFREYGERGLQSAAHYMDALAELTREHGIHLTIAVYPWPNQILHNDLNSIQVRFWNDWAEQTHVDFLNFFPCFVQADGNAADHKAVRERYFLKGDAHWNSAGHELIADNFLALYNRLDPDTACALCRNSAGLLGNAAPAFGRQCKPPWLKTGNNLPRVMPRVPRHTEPARPNT